jgi:hypothetical protein
LKSRRKYKNISTSIMKYNSVKVTSSYICKAIKDITDNNKHRTNFADNLLGIGGHYLSKYISVIALRICNNFPYSLNVMVRLDDILRLMISRYDILYCF